MVRTIESRLRLALAVAAVTSILAPLPTTDVAAATSNKDVENACREDYFRHCSAYPVGNPALRYCMEAKAKQLTNICVRAMIDSGLVDRKLLTRRD